MVFSWILFLGFVYGMDNIIDSGIAISVDRNLPSGPVKFFHQFNHHFSFRNRIPTVVFITFKGEMVGFGQIGRGPLDRPVSDDFNRSGLEKISVVACYIQFVFDDFFSSPV